MPRFPIMENRDVDPDDYPRARHACWAMPGTVALIVLMILAFAMEFNPAEKPNRTSAGAVVLASSTQPGVAAAKP